MDRTRCFGEGDPLMEEYHDGEWGVPVHDPRELFEHLTLEIFQAGLSWRTILHKREGFRRAFAGFEPAAIAQFDEDRVGQLMQDHRIVRNRRKIEATIGNARAYQALESSRGFATFLWSFVEHETIRGPAAERWDQSPTESPQSRAMAAGLKRRGFSFIGPTICYALMQAVGMVDGHLVGCYKYCGGS